MATRGPRRGKKTRKECRARKDREQSDTVRKRLWQDIYAHCGGSDRPMVPILKRKARRHCYVHERWPSLKELLEQVRPTPKSERSPARPIFGSYGSRKALEAAYRRLFAEIDATFLPDTSANNWFKDMARLRFAEKGTLPPFEELSEMYKKQKP